LTDENNLQESSTQFKQRVHTAYKNKLNQLREKMKARQVELNTDFATKLFLQDPVL